MKRLIIALAIVFAFGSHSGGQNPSVKERLADSLYNKAKYLWTNNTDSARYYLQLTLKLSRESNYLKGEANALKGLGFISPSNAEAIQCYTQALSIREHIKDSIGIGASLFDIGTIYRDLGDEEKWISYLNRSYEIRKKIREMGGIAVCLIEFGDLELKNKHYENALAKFKEALWYRIKVDKVEGIAYAHINMASAYMHLNHYDSAIHYATLAKKEFTKINSLRSIGWPVSVISESNLKLGKLDQALNELNSFEEKDSSRPRLSKRGMYHLKLFAAIYEGKNDYKKALYYQKEWMAKNDQDIQESNDNETRKLIADYEFKINEFKLKQEEEKQLLEKSRHDNLEFLVIAFLLIGIFVFIISARKKVSERTANIFTFIGFLLVFEFLVVLFEPRLQVITKNEPFLILLGNTFIAAVVAPLHSLVEKKFKMLLVRPQG